MCVCVLECVYSHVYVGVNACVWQPEVGVECLSLYILYVEVGSRLNPELTDWLVSLAILLLGSNLSSRVLGL